jgi:hypothetical protein
MNDVILNEDDVYPVQGLHRTPTQLQTHGECRPTKEQSILSPLRLQSLQQAREGPCT